MHYIRCLRAPKLVLSGKTPHVELLFTITTDLGDSFLFPDEPLALCVTADIYDAQGKQSWSFTRQDELFWKPGQRVSKPNLRLPLAISKGLATGQNVQICISAVEKSSADDARKVLSNQGNGLVMPVWLTLNPRNDADRSVSTRKLPLSDESGLPVQVDVNEEIGESIARHIWDAGVVASCAIAGTFHHPNLEASQGPCMQAMHEVLSSSGPLNILELGCGVGILGVVLATLCFGERPDVSQERNILMTDLEEAENQAHSNIARVARDVDSWLSYENLDWEDGRRAQFGPTVSSRPWDLVVLSDCTYNVDMLPALVETLSALHFANLGKDADQRRSETKVFLATKPRHSSEQALFDLMAQHGWETVREQIVPLPSLGSEPERIELYLFAKR